MVCILNSHKIGMCPVFNIKLHSTPHQLRQRWMANVFPQCTCCVLHYSALYSGFQKYFFIESSGHLFFLNAAIWTHFPCWGLSHILRQCPLPTTGAKMLATSCFHLGPMTQALPQVRQVFQTATALAPCWEISGACSRVWTWWQQKSCLYWTGSMPSFSGLFLAT